MCDRFECYYMTDNNSNRSKLVYESMVPNVKKLPKIEGIVNGYHNSSFNSNNMLVWNKGYNSGDCCNNLAECVTKISGIKNYNCK
jgi:hypothetical protein